MKRHAFALIGWFLTRIEGFVIVPGIIKTPNQFRDFVGEEPFRFPYLSSGTTILSPNVPKWDETPAIVGFRA